MSLSKRSQAEYFFSKPVRWIWKERKKNECKVVPFGSRLTMSCRHAQWRDRAFDCRVVSWGRHPSVEKISVTLVNTSGSNFCGEWQHLRFLTEFSTLNTKCTMKWVYSSGVHLMGGFLKWLSKRSRAEFVFSGPVRWMESGFVWVVLAISLQFASRTNDTSLLYLRAARRICESSLPSHCTNDPAVFIPRAVRVRIASNWCASSTCVPQDDLFAEYGSASPGIRSLLQWRKDRLLQAKFLDS